MCKNIYSRHLLHTPENACIYGRFSFFKVRKVRTLGTPGAARRGAEKTKAEKAHKRITQRETDRHTHRLISLFLLSFILQSKLHKNKAPSLCKIVTPLFYCVSDCSLSILCIDNTTAKGVRFMAYPTKYCKELVAKMESWLEERQAKDEYPSVAGLAVFLGVPHSTLEDWGTENARNYHADVARVLACVRDYRLSWLERHGLDGSAQPQIAKLLLSAHHNINERTSQDVTLGQDENHPFKVSVVVDLGDGV